MINCWQALARQHTVFWDPLDVLVVLCYSKNKLKVQKTFVCQNPCMGPMVLYYRLCTIM